MKSANYIHHSRNRLPRTGGFSSIVAFRADGATTVARRDVFPARENGYMG